MFGFNAGFYLLLCLFLLVASCSERDNETIGEGCHSNWQCDTGLCINFSFYDPSYYCSRVCEISEDCPEDSVCTVLPSCVKYCAPSCGEPPFVVTADSNYLCAGGIPVRCDLIEGGEYCEYCGCEAGEYCDTGLSPYRCAAKLEEGRPCDSSEQCLSGTCEEAAPGEGFRCR